MNRKTTTLLLSAALLATTLAAQADAPPATPITWGSAQNITGQRGQA
jgi:Spy/CpxP family protein refolding chaperone